MRSHRTFLALALLGLAACADREGSARPVRVVLITLDTLREDALGAPDGAEPALKDLAARARAGATFPRFHVASNVTQPSHASLFTSLQPWEHGVTRNGQVLGDHHTVLAETFADAGFATGAVVSSFPVGRRFGFARGFSRFEEVFERALVEGYREWEGQEIPDGRFYALSGPVVDAAIRMLDTMEGERQFLWFHFFDPHDPYGDTTSGPALEMPALEYFRAIQAPGLRQLLARGRELYLADVRNLDRELDRLLVRVLEESARFDTHILIAADHGESFGEGGHVGHGESLGSQEIRVPLVVLSPALDAGEHDEILGSVDLAPLLLHLAGLLPARPPPADTAYGMQRSCAPGPAEASLPPCEDGLFYAVIDGVLYAGSPDAIRRDDAAASAAPESILRPLSRTFAGFAAQARETPAEELLDPQTRERLRALGYAR